MDGRMWNTITTSTNTNKILFIVLMLISICSDINPQNGKSGNNKFTEFISKAFKLGLTPGMAVGVVKDNEVIYAEGFGVTDITAGEKVSPETLFYIASTTKSFTGLAGALLDHESLLDLDKPFTDYLPDFEFNTELKDSVITLRELLTHTHGIAENLPVIIRTAYTGDFTNDLLLSLLKNSIPAEKGRAFDYTNLGYVIYGLVMDEQFESGWKTMLEQKIFKPLGMYNTHAYIGNADKENLAMPHQIASNGYSILHYGKTTANMHAAGGHISSVNDLAKWLLVHINRGKLNGVQIFPEKVINETHRLGAVQDREFGNIKRYGWGLGWDLGVYDGDTIIHRFGSFTGFRSHVSFMPSHKLGVVVLVNEAVTGSYLADLVAEYIYDLLLEKPRLSN
ncbi:MAG: serine hydrolase, partial [Melioribacteraceae bacterium]|nr:serine hydrolase [Melioribacteraceae bacterium]